MQLHNYYCYRGKPSEIEEDLGVNKLSLDDVIRWHDRAALEEYTNVKVGTMYKYGWNQQDYNINFNHYKNINK